MKNAVTILTRRCPHNCRYCAIRDEGKVREELTVPQWNRAWDILREMGVEFNTILGNEPWLLGSKLIDIVCHNDISYAVYTSCYAPLFRKYRDILLHKIDNLSCGVDWPLSYLERKQGRLDATERKSRDAWIALKWTRKHYPEVRCYGNITICKNNVQFVPEIVSDLDRIGVFAEVNPIHWNKDGGYDFCAAKEEVSDLLFSDTEEDTKLLQDVLNEVVIAGSKHFRSLEYLEEVSASTMIRLDWKCLGDPYGGPTIDSDGSLRVCGYRRGKRTPTFSIFDLPSKEAAWREAVYEDAMECPGCAWGCAWGYQYWKTRDESMGSRVFSHREEDEKVIEQYSRSGTSCN